MDHDPVWMAEQASSSLDRLLPRIEERFGDRTDPAEWQAYLERLKAHFPRVFERLYGLYGRYYDFFYHLESILVSTTEAWLARSAELKALDAMRSTDPGWYRSNRMVGAMAYVDLFAGDLAGLRERIPYLTELGIRYLHLMPLMRRPETDNDGGYAVSSFREVDPSFGTNEDLVALATELRHHGISLTLDLVLNHTSDEHDWARRALAGDREYQGYYRMFPDRTMPDAYERGMPEVFTQDHPGAFTYNVRMRRWVWTTFHTYQWDLNYENPVVFNRILEEMLYVANLGVEILRLDAVAFLWKRLDTDCQNLPEAHWILQALNGLAAIAAPAMVFKSEAIVHPDEVRKYVGLDECPLSYNPQLMALLWDALATRNVRALRQAMNERFSVPDGCEWVNYVRCHDDIGWAFSDDDIEAAGFDPEEHRRFLTRFYTGRHPGSFARGEPFQENRATGDARVSGTCASLVGIERGLVDDDPGEVDLGIRRMLLLHGVIMTLGGIPLLYLGDEIATLNDHGYTDDPTKVGDTRWLHRSRFDWERAEERRDPETVPGRVYQGLLRLVQLRGQTRAFARGDTGIVNTGNDHVFGYFRANEHGTAFVLANFSEAGQRLEARRLRQMGVRKTMVDLFEGRTITAAEELRLEPYQFMVLA